MGFVDERWWRADHGGGKACRGVILYRMSDEPLDELTRARRRARRRFFSRRERLGQALAWPAGFGVILDLFGVIDGRPLGIFWLLGLVLANNALWPFRHRPKRLMPAKPLGALAALGSMAPGTRVHVRGRIRAQERMSTYLGTIDDAVYSRLALIGVQDTSGERHRDLPVAWERALSFTIVGDDEAPVEILMREATVVQPWRRLLTRHRNLAEALLDEAMPFWRGNAQMRLIEPSVVEYWLQEGDEVEVVGTLEHRPDAQRESLHREMHSRPVLVSAAEGPLTVQLVRGTAVRK
jgi:hypothetical protein